MNELIDKAKARNLTTIHFALHVNTLKAFGDEKHPVYSDLPLYFDLDIGESEIVLFAEEADTAVIHQFQAEID